METNPRAKLNTSQRMRVLALMARGDTFAQIIDYLQKQYDITIHDSTLSQIKKRHADTLAEMTRTIVEHEAVEAEDILRKSRRMISRKLTKAEADAAAIVDLDIQLRDGKITPKEHTTKKAGLIELSISQLVAVSREMHSQSMKDIPPGIPPGTTPALAATGAGATLIEPIVAAIKRGDTVELQRLIFRKDTNDQLQPVQG